MWLFKNKGENIMHNSTTFRITSTAIFLSLLLSVQLFTKVMGQFVTGSLINLILILSCLLVSLWSGVLIALLSPFLAFLIGIGPPFPIIIPFISIANIIIVLIGYFVILKTHQMNKIPKYIFSFFGMTIASILKAGFLWLTITYFVLSTFSKVSSIQYNLISAMFSWNQLVTALIGSSIAVVIYPNLNRAINQRN